MIFTAVATAFGAGFLASLSPCVYPMLPLTIGFLTKQSSSEELSKKRKRFQVISFFVGQVLTFTLLGLTAVWLGEIFGFSSQSPVVHFSIAAFLLMMAIGSFTEKFQNIFAKFNQVIQGNKVKTPALLTGFVFGASSALVASPCTSPVLGGVLSHLASGSTLMEGFIQMLAFSLGMGLIFLLVGLGLLNFKQLPKSGRWLERTHQLTAVLLVSAAGYYLYLGFTG